MKKAYQEIWFLASASFYLPSFIKLEQSKQNESILSILIFFYITTRLVGRILQEKKLKRMLLKGNNNVLLKYLDL